ncbi:HNH endonuclease [Aromatoleum evansii]|uniref:HNH endonuclease n=1 Tax=Aromatoleum evansii TaxID=59406 RepID=A0ABZ1AQX1_AROEV|nr:HNH endonuclease [Aromatoleum evansii]WRL48341.1 HNH endonuclease [Aromatoleum evansii]
MNRVTRKCEHCGGDFTRPASQMTESARFCSKACYDMAQTTGERETFMCECCGETFMRLKSWNPESQRRFCSDGCQRIVMVREQHPRWKGGISIDSDGAEITYMPRKGVVANYIRTHRKIASAAIGRLLDRHEHVLHINNDIDDNRPENLFICGSVNECLRRIYGSMSWPTKSNLAAYK